ncbi:MAG TPA: hypothetical protein VF613_06185 [Longimicrobium sp.]|jgi:hypothetical protein
MMKKSGSLLTMSAAAFLVACGGNPPSAAPTPQAARTPPAAAGVAVRPVATNERLTDERVMDLARGYVEMLHARDFEKLWHAMAPEPKQRFGSLEQFRTGGERILTEFGAEMAVLSETVEPARTGMIADKVYLRSSYYARSGGTPVRMMIGLKSDGSIAGFQLRRAE